MPIEELAISRIKIIDDNSLARRGLALTLIDIKCEPVDEPGPLRNLEEFVDASIKSVDAVICDHRLTTYAKFSGAQAVAQFYQRQFPAILCTAWSRADIDAMRPYRHLIPVVINSGDVNPETIVEGFRLCKKELGGEFSSARKPWRTLIRVVELDEEVKNFYVVIPPWDSMEVIRLPIELLPDSLKAELKPNSRFHAQVNLGAEDQNDLYFKDFEAS